MTFEKPPLAISLDDELASIQGIGDLNTASDESEKSSPVNTEPIDAEHVNDSELNIVYLRGARFATIALTFVALFSPTPHIVR